MPSLLARVAALLGRRARPPGSATDRRADLRTALASNLEQASHDRTLTGEQRIAWLVHHLDLYVRRLLAFAVLPDAQPESLVRGDLFVLVELALDAIRAEAAVADHPARFATALAEATTTVSEVRAARTKAAFESLRPIPDRLNYAL